MSLPNEPTDMEFWPLLKVAIETHTGFVCEQYSDSFLTRRVLSRLIVLKINSYKEYLALLQSTALEPELLLRELTIHVTNFFRDQSLWLELIQTILPQLAHAKTAAATKDAAAKKRIVIWSAGCSSGEEPVSLAICCYEAFGRGLSGFDITIVGTDIDPEILLKAKTGTYSSLQCKELPQGFVERYFDIISTHDGPFISEQIIRPKPFITNLITYKMTDIINDVAIEHADIIMCRNTVIYFKPEVKSVLYVRFYKALTTPGFLILGKTELLQGPSREMFRIANSGERIYIKE